VPHHEKANLIHETDLTLFRSRQLADAGGVQVLIHPFDDKRLRVLGQLGRCRESETRLKESD
jgi:hypothetical protein